MKENPIEIAKAWTKNLYFDEADRKELEELITKEDIEEINERFSSDLEFGTGGMRSILGMGRNRINKYNIRKATQAMASAAIKNQKSDSLKAAVSFDCRSFSFEFAKEAASVFAANGIKTYLFKELTPTPILSYAIRYFKTDVGVMITASHNPKQYNGYKAYWSDGAQITPPEDSYVINEFKSIDSFEDVKVMDFDKALSENKIEWIEDDLFDSFYKNIVDDSLNLDMCKNDGDKLNAIYTSLHGTGYKACLEISNKLGFTNFKAVEEQASFDSQFSTVKPTPNPEDPIALEMAVTKMLNEKADVAYGTDPDCDRLGVVVNHKNEAHYLNGNQIAILMIEYLLTQLKEKNKLPKNPLIIKSIVTSNLQRTIANKFDVTVLDTLTGFKWMAKLIRDLENQKSDYNFVFASEESFGYMPNNKVRDKDAVAAIALMNEITLFNKIKGKNLIEKLDEIYETYGFAKESLIANTYEGLSGRRKINNIMAHFRNFKEDSIASEKVKILRDYESLVSKDFSSNTESKIDMHPSDVLGFVFESGNVLYLRPSGTEPKIKFYTMVTVEDGSLVKKKDIADKKIQEIESYINEVIEGL